MLEIMFVIHMPVPEELPATFLWMEPPARHHTHYPSLGTQKPGSRVTQADGLSTTGKLSRTGFWETIVLLLAGHHSGLPRASSSPMKEFRCSTLSSVKAEFIRMKWAIVRNESR